MHERAGNTSRLDSYASRFTDEVAASLVSFRATRGPSRLCTLSIRAYAVPQRLHLAENLAYGKA